MSDQASSTIVVDADPHAIMAVIADLGAYPEWAAFTDEVQVLETYPDGLAKRARFSLDAGLIKDSYTVEYDWAPDSVTWTLVEGHMLKALDGEYVISPAQGGCEVRYRLEVDTAVPVIGLLKRKAEKVIIDSALKGLKKRVEGHAPDPDPVIADIEVQD